MNDWVTIASFNYAHQAALLKSRLESENILCNLKDEFTATAYTFYSNAIGGVKVQVPSNEVQRVIPILKDLGYDIREDGSYSTLVEKVIRFTQKIPVINKLPLERRYTVLIIGAAICMAVVIGAIYFISGW